MKYLTKLTKEGKLVIVPVNEVITSEGKVLLKKASVKPCIDPPSSLLRWFELDLPCRDAILQEYFDADLGTLFDTYHFNSCVQRHFSWNGMHFRLDDEIIKNGRSFRGILPKIFHNHLVNGIFNLSLAHLLSSLLELDKMFLVKLQAILQQDSPSILPNGYLEGYVVVSSGTTVGFQSHPIESTINGSTSVFCNVTKIPYSGINFLTIFNVIFPISDVVECFDNGEMVVNNPTVTGVNYTLTEKANQVKNTLQNLRTQALLSLDREQPKSNDYEFIPPQYWGLNRATILTT